MSFLDKDERKEADQATAQRHLCSAPDALHRVTLKLSSPERRSVVALRFALI